MSFKIIKWIVDRFRVKAFSSLGFFFKPYSYSRFQALFFLVIARFHCCLQYFVASLFFLKPRQTSHNSPWLAWKCTQHCTQLSMSTKGGSLTWILIYVDWGTLYSVHFVMNKDRVNCFFGWKFVYSDSHYYVFSLPYLSVLICCSAALVWKSCGDSGKRKTNYNDLI